MWFQIRKVCSKWRTHPGFKIYRVNSGIPWFSWVDITAHMNFMIVPDLHSCHAASMTKASCDSPDLYTLQTGDKVRSKWSCESKRRLSLVSTVFQQQVKIIWTNSQKGNNKMPLSLTGNLDIQSFLCNQTWKNSKRTNKLKEARGSLAREQV